MTDKEMIQKWKEQVYDKGADVDPNNEYIWEGVAIGFFIGLGASVEDAKRLANMAPL